jgi:hypothetical protein
MTISRGRAKIIIGSAFSGVLIAFCSPAISQTATAEYRADLARLFAEAWGSTGAQRQIQMLIPTLRAEIKKQNPQLVEKQVELLSTEVAVLVEVVGREPARVVDSIASTMVTEFSHDDVRHILSFYLSPAGQKWMRIAFDERFSERIFRTWLQSNMPDVCKRMNVRLRVESAPEMPRTVCP